MVTSSGRKGCAVNEVHLLSKSKTKESLKGMFQNIGYLCMVYGSTTHMHFSPLPGFESRPGHVRKLPVRRWFSRGSPVSSITNNWLVTN